MEIQTIIVAIILAAAVFYLARSIYKSAKGNACEAGCCAHDNKPKKTAKV